MDENEKYTVMTPEEFEWGLTVLRTKKKSGLISEKKFKKMLRNLVFDFGRQEETREEWFMKLLAEARAREEEFYKNWQ